mgnify:CR=1 FL=1
MASEWDTTLDVDEADVRDSLGMGQQWEDPHFSANDMSLYMVRTVVVWCVGWCQAGAMSVGSVLGVAGNMVTRSDVWPLQDLSSLPEYADQEPRVSQGPHSW